MSRSPSTVTLYHVPATGILATSRQAALLQSLQDACESVADLKVGINPAEVIDKAMAAEVVELEGTFPVFADILPLFRPLPVLVPADWRPAHALDLPAKYGVSEWRAGDAVFSTREDAFRYCARLNARNLGKDGVCGHWWIIVEQGNPLADSDGEEFQWCEATFEDGVGTLESATVYAIRVVVPTAEDIERAEILIAEWQDERESVTPAALA